MIRPVIIFLCAATFVFVTACESDDQDKPHHHQFGYNGETPTEVGPNADNGATPPSTDTGGPDNGGPIAPPPPSPPPTTPPDQANPNAPAGVKKDYPYATPVAGKPGFVTSPYAPYSGYVDVRGFPPGTEVKDPYTQKIFLVP